MSKTVEDIGTLKINLLSQAQYDAEKAGGRLADDELYLTPSSGTGVSDVEVNGSSVVSGGVAEITINDVPSGGTTGQVLTKDSGTDYDFSWEDPSGGAGVFVAEYGVTPYADIRDAILDGQSVICTMLDDDLMITLVLADYDFDYGIIDFSVLAHSMGRYIYVDSNEEWGGTVFSMATTDTATTSLAGLMSSSDKTKLNGIASGAEVNVQSNWSQSDSTADDYIKNKPTIPTITDTYSGTSSNGMSGKAVKSAIDALDGTISGSAGAGKTLTAFSQTDGKVSATFSNISITKSQVSDFPTIPTVNDATLTIQKNGTTVNTFTANASSNVTANITVPTDTGDLTNGAGYITTETDPTVPSWAKQVSKPSYTASEVGALPDTTPIPSKTSDLNNDSGFITGVTSTSTPTASTIAEFDSSAHMNSTDMSAQDVSDFVDDLNVSPINLIDMFYPVGSYYETSDTTFNPNITWGGTWSREDWLSTDEYDITTAFNTDQFSNTTYTATRSGFILFSVVSTARNYVGVLLNSTNIIDTCASSATASTSEVHEVIIPMKVGDVLSVNGLSSTCWIASTRNKYFAYKIIGNRWHRTA